MKKRLLDLTFVLLILLFVFALVSKPEICRGGAVSGILLCGRVIIPSVFPFTMCVLFIMNSGTVSRLKFITPFTRAISGLPADIFLIALFSLIGGYPIGAKLLNNAVSDKKLSPSQAGIILNFCINGGPAFIISAVGNGILGSFRLGVVLWLAHLISALAMGAVLRFFIHIKNSDHSTEGSSYSAADNFVASAAEASSVSLNICGYVILFAVINAYIRYFSGKAAFLNIFGMLLEVTNAVTFTDNIYLISFVLGFGGISVWCQVFSFAKQININRMRFLLFRILHGALSVAVTAALLKLFPMYVQTISNKTDIGFSFFYSSASAGISLIIMGVVFLIGLGGKKSLLSDLH